MKRTTILPLLAAAALCIAGCSSCAPSDDGAAAPSAGKAKGAAAATGAK